MDSKKAHCEIGFIGLGIMGKPMVKNLLMSGYKVSFFARRKKVIDEISAIGGIYIKNISDLPKSCKVIMLNLPKSNDVHNIVLGKRGLYKNILPDTTLIDMSTISPDVTVEIADKLKEKKSYLIDAPVSGGEIGAINGNLSIMVGGQKKIFNKVLPILSVLGENITYIGKNGSGQITKACNQILVAGTLVAVSEVLLMAKKSGCNLNLVREALMGGFANSKILEVHGNRMISSDYKPGFKSKLHLKDLDIALNIAKDLNINLKGTKYSRKLMHQSVVDKKQEKDSSVIHEIIKKINK
ncbi:MAG: NAD(P)-dependent oxidoreductase [Gammaproteobacteria bacterium]|tara:strand:+ start:1515 stop:2405 length:891 start_codon:yes stop_codon:yes gene_type:complete